MAGIYLHIPFCLKKCNYCNFHFSTRQDYLDKLILYIQKELELQKNFLSSPIETIYFGGGTPSLLNIKHIVNIFKIINNHYNLSNLQEITFESNPDDLSYSYLENLKNYTPINRLSIGIQSFFEEDLKFMNRAHNSEQALQSVILAQKIGFKNITIDLIYGSPTTTDKIWNQNLETAINLQVPHISAYALTVEPKTILGSLIKKSKISAPDENQQWIQFNLLREKLSTNGYMQYEFSNFGKKGFFSQHNLSYWQKIPYLGIGPSAHSFDGYSKRTWNLSNNIKYIQALKENKLPQEIEYLSEKDRFNETIMLGLRTQWGIDLETINKDFSPIFSNHLQLSLDLLQKQTKILIKEHKIFINPKYLFQTDGIISELFYID